MSLFTELKRRNVFRVTAAYVVIGWLLLQVGDVVFEALELDASANRMLMAFVLLGLIPTILFAWAFELTPDGIKRDKDVERNDKQDKHTAKKLDYVTMGVLIVIGAMGLWQNWENDEPNKMTSTDSQLATPNPPLINPTINDKSLAVLPFINIANTKDNEPFTIGIHDDLITSISKISALKVISRTSVLKYNSMDMPIKEIAKKLGVAHIVEGGVQRVGDLVRLNVKLVDAQTAEHLWTETYNRQLTTSNIFQIQTEVTQKIATALKAQLTDAEVQSLGKQQTQNLDAYNAYLAGRQRLLTRNTQSLKEALTLFEKATNLDPNYALAYVGQADTWNLLNNYSDVTKDEMLVKGQPLLEKALSLDPTLAEAHTSQASYLTDQGKHKEAQEGFERSIKLNPNYPTTYHWYGNLLIDMGKKDQALAMFEKSVELDPISPAVRSNIASNLSAAGHHQEALAQFERISELSPEYPGSESGKAMVYSNMGQLDEAIKWQSIAIEKDPGNVYRRVELAAMYVDIGLDDLAENTLEKIEAQFPDFTGIIDARSTLDMFRGEYQKAASRYDTAFQKNPKNFKYFAMLLHYKTLMGQHEEAIAGYLKLYPGKFGKEFDINNKDLESVYNLIWLWQVSGQEEKAKQLIDELKQLLAENPELNESNKRAKPMIAALEGKYNYSAELFFDLYKKGEGRGFWRGAHLPMLAKVMESIADFEFFKLYDYELTQQRERVLAYNNI
jgi:TolB-like protein/cytochrome c-type biogenesis protein CcmH/NrfG